MKRQRSSTGVHRENRPPRPGAQRCAGLGVTEQDLRRRSAAAFLYGGLARLNRGGVKQYPAPFLPSGRPSALGSGLRGDRTRSEPWVGFISPAATLRRCDDGGSRRCPTHANDLTRADAGPVMFHRGADRQSRCGSSAPSLCRRIIWAATLVIATWPIMPAQLQAAAVEPAGRWRVTVMEPFGCCCCCSSLPFWFAIGIIVAQLPARSSAGPKSIAFDGVFRRRRPGSPPHSDDRQTSAVPGLEKHRRRRLA